MADKSQKKVISVANDTQLLKSLLFRIERLEKALNIQLKEITKSPEGDFLKTRA
ncbi:MAG: hypothetical protein IIA83_12720 [Thaumarchaeota archaeon]|nr:hypothetical protein [Nitrososphaerota archaeon]